MVNKVSVPELRRLASLAIGTRDGDFINLENAWARVSIVRAGNASEPHVWLAGGDASPVAFPELPEAIAYAFRVLADYARDCTTHRSE